MNNLEKAKSLLSGNTTCVLIKDDVTYISEEKGIKPMMSFIAQQIDLKGFCIADKIVGKAAAMLFVYAGITEVYGEVMSKSAVEVLKKYKVKYLYSVLTDKIINRKGDGVCPMELTVSDVDSVCEAYEKLKEKIQAMKN